MNHLHLIPSLGFLGHPTAGLWDLILSHSLCPLPAVYLTWFVPNTLASGPLLAAAQSHSTSPHPTLVSIDLSASCLSFDAALLFLPTAHPAVGKLSACIPFQDPHQPEG